MRYKMQCGTDEIQNRWDAEQMKYGIDETLNRWDTEYMRYGTDKTWHQTNAICKHNMTALLIFSLSQLVAADVIHPYHSSKNFE